MQAQAASLRDQLQYLTGTAASGTVKREECDRLRDEHRATTRTLLLAVLRRKAFERSKGFSRNECHRQLRRTAVSEPELIRLSDAADRLDRGYEALSGQGVKREATCCAAQSARRPVVACNTLQLQAAPKRRRIYPTPHPRAGKEAVAAAGGSQSAMQALIDEETPRSLSEEEQETVEGAVFSSDEEEPDYNF